jgi:hypothetical protein
MAMKWKLIVESKTPSDMESIEASFNKDVSDEKYTPTEIFIQVGKTNDGTPEAFKILTKNKDKCLSILKERGYKQVALLASKNPKSVELKPTRPTRDMSIRVYRLGDEFTRKYGPFKKVEDVDLTSLVFESDEDDSTFKTMSQIKGLRVRKLPNGSIEMVIA